MSAYYSFFQFMRELNVSKRRSNVFWHMFKNLPIKEGDNIVILGHAPELGAWLVKYGLASSMKIYSDNFHKNYDPQTEKEILNSFRKNKEEYLPDCQLFNIHNNFKLKNIEQADLIIFYNKNFVYVTNMLLLLSPIKIRFYVKMSRHINVYDDLRYVNENFDLTHTFSEKYLASLSNDVRFSLMLNLLGSYLNNKRFVLKNSNQFDYGKISYKNSFPRKSLVYKDIVFS